MSDVNESSHYNDSHDSHDSSDAVRLIIDGAAKMILDSGETYRVLSFWNNQFLEELATILATKNVWCIIASGFKWTYHDLLALIDLIAHYNVELLSLYNGDFTGDFSGHISEQNLTALADLLACTNIKSLGLGNCTGIINVSPFGRMHTLDLSGCKSIVDVSSLSLVQNLDLSGCTGIVDVSALAAVHTLNLTGCTGITVFDFVSFSRQS